MCWRFRSGTSSACWRIRPSRQAGYVLIGVAAVGTLGPAVLYYLAAYVLTNIVAFAVVIAVTNDGQQLIEDMAGFSRRSPGVALAMLAAMFSLAGVPPLAGFFAKFYILMRRSGMWSPRAGSAFWCGWRRRRAEQHRGVVLLSDHPKGHLRRSGRG